MKPFFIALLFIAAIFSVHYFVVNISPDRSVESGVKHHIPQDGPREAQEAE